MTNSEAERRAMQRALVLAVTPGVPLGPNPRVGCVRLDAAGHTLGEGFHRGAGTPHAEVAALADARVTIPMAGSAESLNVAAAAAICLYESARAMRAH